MLLSAVLLMAASISPTADVPYRQPQLASGHGLVAMTFGGGSSVYFASSTDEGRTFSAPVKVGEEGALALGRHRGPRVAVLKDAIVISAIGAVRKAAGPHAHGLPENGNLVTWRSTDRGKTWKRAAVINDVPGAAREGLHAMAAGRDSSLFAVWLDLRVKGMRLFGSRSADGGLTWSRNVEVYASPAGTICQCCHPGLTIDESGRIWVMWRNVMEGSRDLYIASSTDGVHFSPAAKQGAGTWKLNACPMDGGGFAVTGGQAVSAWRREGEIYLAEPGKPEKRVGAGKDVALARGKQGTYLAWTRQGSLELLSPTSAGPAVLAPEGGFVSLVALEDGSVLAAWEARQSIETKRLH